MRISNLLFFTSLCLGTAYSATTANLADLQSELAVLKTKSAILSEEIAQAKMAQSLNKNRSNVSDIRLNQISSFNGVNQVVINNKSYSVGDKINDRFILSKILAHGVVVENVETKKTRQIFLGS